MRISDWSSDVCSSDLGVRRFLIVALLMQMSFGPFYVFYTLNLQAHGHGGLAIGSLWAIGVLAEIALFWVAPQLIARFGAPRLLSLSLAVTITRWLLVAWLDRKSTRLNSSH